jgi:hypothetical protein
VNDFLHSYLGHFNPYHPNYDLNYLYWGVATFLVLLLGFAALAHRERKRGCTKDSVEFVGIAGAAISVFSGVAWPMAHGVIGIMIAIMTFFVIAWLVGSIIAPSANCPPSEHRTDYPF